jgi:hypothetical protein
VFDKIEELGLVVPLWPYYISLGYLTALSVARYSIELLDDRLTMNWKGFGRKRLWPDRDNIPRFTRKDRGKPRRTSVRLAGVRVEIRTEHLPDTSVGR